MSPLRPVHYSTLVAVFERDGFTFNRQRGDHLIYTKPGVARPLVIPAYHEVPVHHQESSPVIGHEPGAIFRNPPESLAKNAIPPDGVTV